ncbi:mvb-12 [Pristionchus pacificus]|uniref:ESCRT-I complex subunit MVB12A n=1 Tax=Pristionchus pacificus TaxID=54126 RepID=A0A8R1YIB5_PRIPA|nr:mvb-12 [Pristionchus pacificus]
MGESELTRSVDMSGEVLPITAICIVADRNKAPIGFTPILKTHDESVDADLWRESAFSIWSRPVRYIAVSREIKTAIPSSRSVITDLTVTKESEPVPHGYIAIDYTADSKEKALRKRFLCVKTEPLESCVDAVTDVIVLSKTKKPPRDHSLAGEVDGILICFKTGVIPPHYGMKQSHSDTNIGFNLGGPSRLGPSSAYPQLDMPHPSSHSTSDLNHVRNDAHNAFTIKGAVPSRINPIEGVNFIVNPRIVNTQKKSSSLPPIPSYDTYFQDEFNYGFQLENATISS